jgi:HAAS
MTNTSEPEKAIETYLVSLRRHLRDLMDEDVRDIVDEIHAHILDKTSADTTPESIASTLAALGSPQQLAVRYHTDELLQRVQLSRSPALVLRVILRWATLSLGGMLVFMLSGIGYCIGGVLFVMALLKAFFPRQAGLNIQYNPGHTWSMGFGAGSGPHTGHDPIGLWLIPICLVLGGGILFLTFRFGTWSLRLFSRPRSAVSAGSAEDLT